jgi:hypothetical protein
MTCVQHQPHAAAATDQPPEGLPAHSTGTAGSNNRQPNTSSSGFWSECFDTPEQLLHVT